MLLVSFLLFLSIAACPGTSELVPIRRSPKPGQGTPFGPQASTSQLQTASGGPFQTAAFIARGSPSSQLRPKQRTPSALWASTTPPVAASCVGSGCRILGVGSAVPDTRMTNDDLSKVVDTNDEWIRTRTGISSRHVLRHGESLRALSLQASLSAVSSSGLKPRDIDLVLHASSSPDDLFGDGPWLGSEIQKGEDGEVRQIPAFDITAACSGFVVGLVTANMYLTSPGSPYKKVLLVGSDALSRWLDWSDRNTCILFGDAAGAAVLAAPDVAPPAKAASANKPLGLLSYVLHSDGSEQKQIMLHYKGTENPLPYMHAPSGRLCLSRGCFSPLSMNGREVFKFVSRKVPSSLESVLSAAKLRGEDVDWLLMHQANKRIIDAVAERLNIPKHKVLCNLEEYGNTSAASVPLCLNEAVRAGKVKDGDVIAMAGFGAGLTWAAAVLRYG
ncbi:uncharacterized protein LOC34619780 [Cyclospora cayetanensis]|nr:uncharacterized protein LOC34619780 [Cyclospora cayetanensis]